MSHAETHDVFVVGAGRAGLAMARALMRGGHRVLGTYSRTADAAARVRSVTQAPAFHGQVPQVCRSATLVLVSVSDDALPTAVRALTRHKLVGKGQVVAHLAGALDSAVLAPAGKLGASIGSLHPVASFAEGSTLPLGTRFAVEGDAHAVAVLQQVVQSIGGDSVVVDPGQKPRYHAALVFASNYMVVMAALAKQLLKEAGVGDEAGMRMLLPLIEGTARNLGRQGVTHALTGPVTRGDANTIRMHLGALSSDPSVARLYSELAIRALELAREQGMSQPELDAMRVVLEHHLEKRH